MKSSEPKAPSPFTPPRSDLPMAEAPDLREIFADAISQWYFDGHLLRIEVAISRLDPPRTGNDPSTTGRRYPVCRLVLSPSAVLDLLNRAQQTGVALEKMGVVAKAAKDPTAG